MYLAKCDILCSGFFNMEYENLQIIIIFMQEQSSVTGNNTEKLNQLLMKKVKNPLFSNRRHPHIFLAFKPTTIKSKKKFNMTSNFTQLLYGIKQQLKNELRSKKFHIEKVPKISQEQVAEVCQQKSISLKLKILNNWLNNQRSTVDLQLEEKQRKQIRSVGQQFMNNTLNKWKANCLKTKNKGAFQAKKKTRIPSTKFSKSQYIKNQGNQSQNVGNISKSVATHDTIPVHSFNIHLRQNKSNSKNLLIQDALKIHNNITFSKNDLSNQTKKNIRKLRTKTQKEQPKQQQKINTDPERTISKSRQLFSTRTIDQVLAKNNRERISKYKVKQSQIHADWIFEPW